VADVSVPPREFHGFRLTAEARAVVSGILVAVMFLMFVAIRLDPSGGAGTHQLTAVSAKTIPEFWVVHTGESYASIAARTGLSVARIEDLNPYVYPDSLEVGQRIRLRP
jgi:LysM repeat protein